MHTLFLLPVAGHQIDPPSRDALELRGSFRTGKVVADAERVSFELVDGGERLAMVRSLRAGNRHALGLAGGIDRVSAPVGIVADEDFVFTAVEFQADGLQDRLGHGLSGQLSRGRHPTSLNCFGIVERVGSEPGQCRGKKQAEVEDGFHHARICNG
jgi:hypothetical protein